MHFARKTESEVTFNKSIDSDTSKVPENAHYTFLWWRFRSSSRGLNLSRPTSTDLWSEPFTTEKTTHWKSISVFISCHLAICQDKLTSRYTFFSCLTSEIPTLAFEHSTLCFLTFQLKPICIKQVFLIFLVRGKHHRQRLLPFTWPSHSQSVKTNDYKYLLLCPACGRHVSRIPSSLSHSITIKSLIVLYKSRRLNHGRNLLFKKFMLQLILVIKNGWNKGLLSIFIIYNRSPSLK